MRTDDFYRGGIFWVIPKLFSESSELIGIARIMIDKGWDFEMYLPLKVVIFMINSVFLCWFFWENKMADVYGFRVYIC